MAEKKTAKKSAKKPKALTAKEQLVIASRHLERVQSAWDPPDWDDLLIYGMYAIEAAILAAATHLRATVKPTHWDKAAFAARLAFEHGLPDVEELVANLNTGRKAAAYGDEEMPEEFSDAEVLATEIEAFVEAVATFIEEDKK